jgi:hypothetical protein
MSINLRRILSVVGNSSVDCRKQQKQRKTQTTPTPDRFYLRLRFMLDGLLAKAKAHFTNIPNTNGIYDALEVPVMRRLLIELLN